MPEQQSIKDTLDVIRRALEDDDTLNTEEIKKEVLILNRLVKDDGTIKILNENKLTKNETINLLSNKLDEVLHIHLSKWLDKNLTNYLKKHLKDKNL